MNRRDLFKRIAGLAVAAPVVAEAAPIVVHQTIELDGKVLAEVVDRQLMNSLRTDKVIIEGFGQHRFGA